jgi:hypothetical protein
MLSLAPSDVAGTVNMCPNASEKCRELCINLSGRGIFANVQNARIRKTHYFVNDRAGFIRDLISDIETLVRDANARGMIPCVRLNGFSDVRWENHGIMERFPNVQFYDYTKFPANQRKNLPANYNLTYSVSEKPESEAQALDWQARGVNCAVVFHGKTLPTSYTIGGRTFPVVNGDESDLRFLDPRNVIVGLKAKGKAVNAPEGFVRWAETVAEGIKA